MVLVNIDLARCAHCGGLCRVVKWGADLFPGCRGCGYTIMGPDGSTFEARAEIWNRRYIPE